MSVVIDGTSGVTTPGVVNTAGETIATTLAVTGVSKFTGNVAIGTATTPTAKLWVDSGRVGLTNTYKLGWHSNPAHGDLANYITGDDNANYVAIGTDAAERMRIDSSGNVGIGTASPTTKLQVQKNGKSFQLWDASTNDGAYMVYAGASTTKNWCIGNQFNVSGALEFTQTSASGGTTIGTTPSMVIDSSGNLLVGSPASNGISGLGVVIKPDGSSGIRLVTSQSTNTQETLAMYSTGAAAYRFYVDWGGTIHATAATITAISDQRLKENVRPLENSLTTINSLNPVRFDWKAGKGLDKKDDVGFIAQEFETVFPNSVAESKAGEDGIAYKSLNHGELIPTLVKAIQELKAIVDAQAVRIAALES